MAADLGLVANAAEGLADEFAAGRPSDRAAERSLADAGWADEAQDRALELIGPRLDGEILDDPVLDLLEAVMILVEHALSLEPGDMVYVPPRETHLLENPSEEEPAEYVVARDAPEEDSVEVPWAT